MHNNINKQEIAKKFFNEKNEKNFNAYYAAYYPIAYRLSKSVMKNHDDATIIAQDCMIKMYMNNQFVFNPDKPHTGYIARIAITRSQVMYKKYNRASHQKPIASPDINQENLLPSDNKCISEILDGNKCETKLNFLNDSLSQLTEQQLTTLGHILDEISSQQFMEIEGLNSVSSVKLRKFRLRNKLRVMINEKELTSSMMDHKLPYDYTGDLTYNRNNHRIVTKYKNGKLDGNYEITTVDNDKNVHKTVGLYGCGKKQGEWKYYLNGYITKMEEYEDDELCYLAEYKDDELINEEFFLEYELS